MAHKEKTGPVQAPGKPIAAGESAASAHHMAAGWGETTCIGQSSKYATTRHAPAKTADTKKDAGFSAANALNVMKPARYIKKARLIQASASRWAGVATRGERLRANSGQWLRQSSRNSGRVTARFVSRSMATARSVAQGRKPYITF